METLVRLNGQRAGRDKLFRTAQFALKLVNSLNKAHLIGLDPNVASNLEKTVSEFRKLLRLGTFFDSLYSIRGVGNIADPTVKTLTTVSRFALAGFLFNDHLIILRNKGVLGPWVDLKTCASSSYRWWLVALIAGIVRDWYELNKALKAKKRYDSHKGPVKLDEAVEELARRKDILNDFVKNVGDMTMALSALGYIELPSWVAAFAGIVSSVAGAIPIIDPTYKLS